MIDFENFRKNWLKGFCEGFGAERPTEIRQLENLFKEHCELAKLDPGDYLMVVEDHAISKSVLSRIPELLSKQFGVRVVLVTARYGSAVRMYRIESGVSRETMHRGSDGRPSD